MFVLFVCAVRDEIASRGAIAQKLHEYQSTALEARSMTKEQFLAADKAGKQARKQICAALKALGYKRIQCHKTLWLVALAYSRMPEKITTQPAAGALVLASPIKRKHEQSEYSESPHTKQRSSKKAKKGTQKAAVTAAEAAEEEAATAAEGEAPAQNGHHWAACDECRKWRRMQNEITAAQWRCKDGGRDCSELEDVCNELEEETEGL